MAELVELRSKLYSHKIFDYEKETKKSKGVNKYIVDKKLNFKDLKNYLTNKQSVFVKQNLFRTKKHEIFRVEQNNKALSAYDEIFSLLTL